MNFEERKVFYINAGEISHQEAIKIIAEWWEKLREEGINVAAMVQKARYEYRQLNNSPDAGDR